MRSIRSFFRVIQTHQQQRLIPTIHHTMNELGQHGRRPARQRRCQFRRGNDEIPTEGTLDIFHRHGMRLCLLFLLFFFDGAAAVEVALGVGEGGVFGGEFVVVYGV